ncbi:hypothetical protein [Amycolatopsis sp. NPDC059021]|uniref:hypothetical protein n=1 Tax=Amycolatopsis sp. NPDC059021 TaxID=3346704 RepID=UPI00366E3643
MAAIAVTGVGASLLTAGTAFASHEEYRGPYANNDECHQALMNFPSDPNVDGLECIVKDGKIFLDISYKN